MSYLIKWTFFTLIRNVYRWHFNNGSLLGFFEADGLGFEVEAGEAGKKFGVESVAAGHGEAPLVLYLAAQVKVELGDQQSVPRAREGGRARAVGGGHVAAAVEMSEVVVCLFPVAAREFVGVDLSAHAVDADCEVMVGDGGVARLDSPKGFGESVDGGGGVEDDFCAVESEAHPMKGVMAAVANVHGDASELSLEDGVPRFTLHVVGGLVEVADAGDVTLFLLAEDVPVVVDDHCRVVQRLLHALPLEDRGHDDHVVPLGQLAQHLRALPVERLSELDPGVPLAGAHEKGGRPDLLQPEHVHALQGCQLDDAADTGHDGVLLLLYGLSGLEDDAVLHCPHAHQPAGPHLFLLAVDAVVLHLHVQLLGPGLRLRPQRHFGGERAIQYLPYAVEQSGRKILPQRVVLAYQLSLLTEKTVHLRVFP